jgi:ABC-2 type transport system permease protein
MSTTETITEVLAPAAARATPDLPRAGLLRPALSLCRRELVRFLRQRHRIVGALATPIVFWLLIGGGVGRSFGGSYGESYIQFFFPGTLIMILLFTAIFSTISIIEDRKEGFLQSVLVAPVSRAAVVLGKVLGGTILAAGQGFLFLLFAPLVGFHFTVLSFAMAVLLMLVMSFALTALGFAIAWSMSSTQGFHAIMNLFLLPLWFLSGAMFPPGGAWWGLRWVMLANPLTYGLAGLRHTMMLGDGRATYLPPPGLLESTLVSCGFAVVLYAIAAAVARRDTAADLQ